MNIYVFLHIYTYTYISFFRKLCFFFFFSLSGSWWEFQLMPGAKCPARMFGIPLLPIKEICGICKRVRKYIVVL